MLDYIAEFVKPNGSPRIVHPWVEYISNIATYIKYYNRRFMIAPEYETMGMQLLRYIINFVDYNWMTKNYNNDYDRYTYYVRFIKEDLENIFDQVSTGRSFYNYFVNNNLGKVDEYILPCEDINTILNLPMNKSWEEWEKVRPVRLMDHGSSEFTVNMFNDRFKFSKISPEYAIITIDVIALIFKYYKYLTIAPENDPNNNAYGKSDRRFIHSYVIIPMLKDLIDCFLINQIDIVSKSTKEEIEQRTSLSLVYDIQFGFIGSRYQEACRYLHKEIMRLTASDVNPTLFLSGPLLMDNKSIVDRIEYTVDNLYIPNLRQYEYYLYLRDRKILSLVTNLYKLTGDSFMFKNYSRKLKYKILKTIRNKCWLSIKNYRIREQVQSELYDTYETLSWL